MTFPTATSGFILWLALLGREVPAQTYRLATAAAPDFSGDGGPASLAHLLFPSGVAVARDGTIYVSQSRHHRVRRIAPNGIITTFAGTGTQAFRGDGGPAVAAELSSPTALAVDARGVVYILDQGNGRVRRVDTDGRIESVAGGAPRSEAGNKSGPALELSLCNPEGGMTLDAAGVLYVSERDVCGRGTGSTVWRVDANGIASNFGSGGRLLSPTCLAFDGAGNLYICDLGDLVRRSPSGQFTTIAGARIGFTSLRTGVPAQGEYIAHPGALATDSAGNLYFATGGVEYSEPSAVFVIRNGMLEPVTGVNQRQSGGYEGEASNRLNGPLGIAVDAAGSLYIADQFNHRIRRYAAGSLSTVAGTRGRPLLANATAPVFAFGFSEALVAAPDGSLYFTDDAAAQIRRIASDGRVTTVAGDGTTVTNDEDRPSLLTPLGRPLSNLALDAAGNLYLHAGDTPWMRRITPEGTVRNLNAAVRTSTGSIAVGPEGVVYYADVFGTLRRFANNATKVVGGGSPYRIALSPGGVLHGISLNTVYRLDGDALAPLLTLLKGAPGLPPNLTPYLFGLAFDSAGTMFLGGYMRENGAGAVWRVGTDNVPRLIAGPVAGITSPDGTPALSASFTVPRSLTVDRAGRIFFSNVHTIRALIPDAAMGGSTGCTIRLLRGNALEVPAAGGDFRVEISGSSYFCPWAVTAPAWIRPGVTGGSGTGTLMLRVEANTGEPRETAVRVGEVSLTVRQLVGQPVIAATGIEGAAGSTPPVRVLSPGGLLVLNGAGFTVNADAVATAPAGGSFPEELLDACVLVDGVRAPVGAVSSRQITFVSPAIEGKEDAEVVVARRCGQTGEARSEPRRMPYRAAAPEFVYAEKGSGGRNAVLAAHGSDGLPAGRHGAPAVPGETVIVYAHGLGVTNPPLPAGANAEADVPVAGEVRVRLGGVLVAAEDVIYAGVLPGFPGYYKVQFRVPGDAAAGDLPVVVSVGEQESPAGAYLTVAR